MFALFDLFNKRVLAVHDSYIGVAALAYIQFANVDTVICRAGNEDKDYAVLLAKDMREMAEALGGTIPHAVFGGCIKQFRELVEGAEWLRLPFTAEQLYRQAASIAPTDARPYAITGGDEPELIKAWHVAPNRNRSRHECPHWIHFTNAEPPPILRVGQNSAAPWNQPAGDATLRPRNNPPSPQPENEMAAAKKKAPAPSAPAKKTAGKAAALAAPKAKADKPAKQKVEKAPKAEKALRIEQNGVKRPKAGTTGDKIWSTADTLSAKKKSPASFDEVSKTLGDSVNEASMRAGYQRWRKFNGLKGRLSSGE